MMPNSFDLTPYRSILCLNGTLPNAHFFEALNLPIIAADGAANSLQLLGLSPQIIIGDLDSVSAEIRANNTVLFCPEQNSCDYQKSLAYMEENHLLPAIVVGINGGYLDHILNNINIFLGTESILYAPPIVGLVIKTAKQLSLPVNTKLSLIGMPAGSISTNGLKWELEHATLSFPGSNSCFNRTQNPVIEITVHQGAVLAMIYTEPMIDVAGQI